MVLKFIQRLAGLATLKWGVLTMSKKYTVILQNHINGLEAEITTNSQKSAIQIIRAFLMGVSDCHYLTICDKLATNLKKYDGKMVGYQGKGFEINIKTLNY